MKLQCKISGLVWDTPALAAIPSHKILGNKNTILSTIHPIMSDTVSYDALLAITSANQWRKLSKQDKRLLSLALANATGLINWMCPISAEPRHLQAQEPQIEQLIIPLREIISFCNRWLDKNSFLTAQASYFPKLVIFSDNNHNLSCIQTIVTEWQSVIYDYHNQYMLDYESRKQAQQQQFLQHLRAFKSRKPSNYIKKLSDYIINCIPRDCFTDSDEREYYRYIIEFSGVNRTIEANPTVEIMRHDVEFLIELIYSECDSNNQFIWQGLAALKHMLETGGYNTYGGTILHKTDAQTAREEELKTIAINELGPRPSEFLAGIRYDAAIIKRIEELKHLGI